MLIQSGIEVVRPAVAGVAPAQADRVRVTQRDHIFHEGDDADALYSIVSGAVMLYRVTFEGTRVVLGVRFPGELIGHAKDGVHSVSALAVQPCLLHRIPREYGVAGWDRCSGCQLTAAYEAELARLADQIMTLSSRNAVGSVAATILDFSDRGAGGAPVVVLPLRRAELADLLALTIETVSRAMTKLRMLGHIEFLRPDVVRIRDRARLHELSSGDGEGAARGRCAL